MMSDAAEHLLQALKDAPGERLCAACAGARARLAMDHEGVLKTMRELVANGHIIHADISRCSACQKTFPSPGFVRPASRALTCDRNHARQSR